MGNFLYPRTISVTRPAADTGTGFVGYSGHTQAGETPVATGLICSIQERREGSGNPVGLPGDGRQPQWYVFIPRGIAANGLIQSLDIITDDLGNRYQVVAPYWDSLGYRITAMTLEP